MKDVLLGLLVIYIASLIMQHFKPTRKFMARDIAFHDISREISKKPDKIKALQELKDQEKLKLQFDDVSRKHNLPIVLNKLDRAEAEARLEVIEKLLKELQ